MLVLDNDEKIIAEIHKHWYNFSLKAIALFLFAIIPLIIFTVVNVYVQAVIPPEVIHITSLLYVIWLLLLWVSLFVSWTLHYLSAWIITNKRIIDIDQDGLFIRKMGSVNYDRIQEIHTQTTGIIPTMLNFGVLTIESAAENTKFVLHDVHNPEHVKLMIEQQVKASHRGL